MHRLDLTYIGDTLGRLHTLAGQHDEASLCAAEVALASGDIKVAQIHAKKALSSKQTAMRARDIIAEAKRQEKQAA